MFTGLIESMGTIVSMKPQKQGFILSVDAGFDLSKDAVGDSIAVDGVCLTATSITKNVFTAAASAETVSRSTLGGLRPGSRVNIERAMTLSTRLGGHLVLGHVDCVGTIGSLSEVSGSMRMSVRFDKKFSRYVIEKGSIAIDGISLTVNRIEQDTFEVNIIPHTATSVTLTHKRPGDRVNLEFDVIGKYVEKLLGKQEGEGLETLLKKQGFI